MLTGNDIERALTAVGELLEARDTRAGIVVIGGAALRLLGIVERTTRDVDIVAVAHEPGDLQQLARPPEPLPPPLKWAIEKVAEDFNLPDNWLNQGPASQWDLALPLPTGFAERVQWRRYGALDVGICSRIDLIHFKLEAAADQPTSDSRHFRDLAALEPTDAELATAAAWVLSNNDGPEFPSILSKVVAHVKTFRRTTDP